jgi:hypothetical protein
MKKISVFVLTMAGFAGMFSSCSDSKARNATYTSNVKEGKSDAELYSEAGKEFLQEKHERDSILRLDKEHMWVYQIGSVMVNAVEADKAFDKLKAISHIYIFKKAPKEFYVIKDDSHSREELMDSLGSIKKQLPAGEDKIEIIDLMNAGPLKKRLASTASSRKPE